MSIVERWPENIRESLVARGLDPQRVADVVSRALAEDLSWGPDITTNATLPANSHSRGDAVTRQAGCLAGIPVAAAVVHTLADQRRDQVEVLMVADDGDRVRPGDVVLSIAGPTRCLLTAERTMLNLLGQLSGVATATAHWVDALVETTAKVRDTRKTVPGLRVLQKYAVRCGGGVNHRMGLGDAALIKDNHIAAAGSLSAAYLAVRERDPKISVEIECDTLDQVCEAIEVGADLLLLDNMDTAMLREAVQVARAAGVRTEASGGLTLADAPAVGATGVDYISVGALTHSAAVLDLGLDLHAGS